MERMSLRTLVAYYLNKYGIKPSKRFDQYFLVNDDVLEKVLDALKLNNNDVVLEVGAGPGIITSIIARRVKKVVAIEKDIRMVSILRKECPGNVEVIMADARKITFPDANKFFSDIPYSLSLPLTLKLLRTNFELGAIICQKEFANKLMAKPNTEQYSRISVIAQYYADISVIADLYKSDFFPEPPIHSKALLFKRARDKNNAFERFVTELFRHRRKKVEGVGKRPEQLSVEEFIHLFEVRA
ncbi:MAG: ribosomal RNA small subunit methyltransferase A [Candidatus Diapherotrites archaeon]|nr:ribosomal RNA small subunit methyltransferase A [Candidatus Diapherotrites archaeon]